VFNVFKFAVSLFKSEKRTQSEPLVLTKESENEDKADSQKIHKIDFTSLVLKNEINLLEIDPLDGNIGPFELQVVCNLVKSFKPENIFEIGTFDGRTTLNMACNSTDNCRIITIDLPQSTAPKLQLAEFEEKYIKKDCSGKRFIGLPQAAKITQLYGDTATFDFSSYYDQFDFVFVDASHSYEYVKNDTQVALKLLKPAGGIILWHDYDTPYWPGVTQALNEYSQNEKTFKDMLHIKDTSIVFLQLKTRTGIA
jgi:predicted O-methyltransferase YrrM